MKFTRLQIPDIILIEPKVFKDERGFFFESYQRALYEESGIRDNFIQDNHSKSSRGVLRGLHYQIAPKAQAKLVRVIKGTVFDVVLDVRKNSKTFGQYIGHILTADLPQALYVPVGFAHGFSVLSDEAEFLYKVSDVYSPQHERGVLWNDPSIGIQWPETNPILSERDKKHPLLKDAEMM